MLREIRIRNIAIIEEAILTPAEGLTVLTGETGAGKSIVIDALELVLGGRGSADLIRSGCDEAAVEALIEVPQGSPVLDKLHDMGIEVDGELVVRRLISATGRGRAYLNGTLVNISTLSDITRGLIDIHGQHEHQSILASDVQLNLLDAFAGLDKAVSSFRERYTGYTEIRKSLDRLAQDERDRAQRQDLLRFQLDEIAAANIVSGEDILLDDEYRRLANAEKLQRLAEEGHELLHSGDHASGESIVKGLKKVTSNINALAGYDNSVSEQMKMAESCLALADDLSIFLRDYASKSEADPERLNTVAERLDLLARLKKKYGNSVDDVLERLSSIRAELVALESSATAKEELEKELALQEDELVSLALALTEKRTAAAVKLENAIKNELADLGMPHTSFIIRFEQYGEGASVKNLIHSGFDRIGFLIAPNPGEEPRTLADSASGGELSRIMLAIKTILAGEDSVPTMIFDEVDTGIGGRVADMVGSKLATIARAHQVLVVTHLPQVAAQADHHFYIEKNVSDGRTYTSVKLLNRKERVVEIARMIGGKEDTAIRHAEEMLVRA